MQISLTKKISDAMGIRPTKSSEDINPLFCWTANWTNTFDGRKEDMVVLVNKATRFVVAIYGIKRNQFKNITTKIINAIRNTFIEHNINTEIIDEYFRLAGEIEYASNNDRQQTAWVNSQGRIVACCMGHKVNNSFKEIKYDDTIGAAINWESVNFSKSFNDSYMPAEKMIQALSALTEKPIYNYCAYEILITLDLEIYKATRRLIVPASIKIEKLHDLIQEVYDWRNCHLYDFKVYEKDKSKPAVVLCPDEEGLEYNDKAVVISGQKLSEYFPKYDKIVYTYDMGDCWEHEIRLINIMENYNQESPYLLESIGQTPPEDVGGVVGYIRFRDISQNPQHPDYTETKEWAGFWNLELSVWEKQSRAIR